MAFLQEQIPNGIKGTAKTIQRMHQLTLAAVQGIGPDDRPDDRIVRLAREIVAAVPARDYVGECAAVLRWCQANLRYVNDPWTPDGLERLQHPCVTIFETRSGDCDELAPCFSALCAAIGRPWAFRTVGVDPLQPNAFIHVYALVQLPCGWAAADPTFPSVPLGWEPPDDDPRVNPMRVRDGVVAVYRRDWQP